MRDSTIAKFIASQSTVSNGPKLVTLGSSPEIALPYAQAAIACPSSFDLRGGEAQTCMHRNGSCLDIFSDYLET